MSEIENVPLESESPNRPKGIWVLRKYWRSILFVLAIPLYAFGYLVYLRLSGVYIYWDLGISNGVLLSVITAFPILLIQFFIVRQFCRWIRKHPLGITGKLVVTAFLLSFIATIVIGMPKIQSQTTQAGMEYYAQLHSGETVTAQTHPYMITHCAIPVVPFVIIQYRESTYAGLNGWGGWTLVVWYGAGIKEYRLVGLWVS